MISGLFIGLCFSVGFILTGLWFNPLVPAAAVATGVLVSIVWAIVAKFRFNKSFRLAYSPNVSRLCLKSVIRAGKPLPSHVITARAAVVAIKCPDLNVSAGEQLAMAVLDFHRKVSSLIKKAGGTIIAAEGNQVTACFGSPLERVLLSNKYKTSPYDNDPASPVLWAVDFVSALTARPESASWQFGLDMGNCAFAWAHLSGYFALGAPVQRARALLHMASRYRARIIISAAVCEALPDLPIRKLGAFRGNNGAGEPFFQLSTSGFTE